MRLAVTQSTAVVVALGSAQTLSWASSYYVPAVLATPMALDLGLSPTWVFAAFSMALVISALAGPFAGRWIDAFGGRGLLGVSNLVLAASLALLASATETVSLFLAFAFMGIAMGIGLYEAAFATLTAIYGSEARARITGITLVAGFASTIGWPLSGLMEAAWGWRFACLGWAALQLAVALPLNLLLPAGGEKSREGKVSAALPAEAGTAAPVPRFAMPLLAFVFAAGLFTSTAMAAHLPRLLEAAGATTTAAIAAGALIGPAQVAARIAEFGLMRRVHPLTTARVASTAHPLAVGALLLFGGPAAFAFAAIHGAGNGIMTIIKGTLPLALFGPAGYGARTGLLNAPARLLQSFAPLIFGLALERFGASAALFTGAIGLLSVAALLALRMPRAS
jgi:MFS family permease